MVALLCLTLLSGMRSVFGMVVLMSLEVLCILITGTFCRTRLRVSLIGMAGIDLRVGA